MISKMQYCPTDGARAKLAISDIKDYFIHHGRGRSFELYFCEQCKTGFTFPQLSYLELIDSYPENYEAYEKRDGFSNLLQKIKFKSDINRIVKNSIGKLIFEIGAGRGEFLAEISRWGFKATGSEPSGFGREAARIQYSITLSNENDTNLLFLERYETVLLKHVLEHTKSPKTLLSNIFNSGLKIGGIVYIKVPNSASIEARIFQKYWHGRDIPRHLWHFTPDGISLLLSEIGYKDVQILQEAVYSDIQRSIGYFIEEKSSLIFRFYQTKIIGLVSIFLCQFFAIILRIFTKHGGRMIIIARKSV